MNRIFIFVIISFIFTSCSLNKDSKLWNKKNKDFNLAKNQKKISVLKEKKEKELRELNPLFQIDLSKIQYKKNSDEYLNNHGSLIYSGSLNEKAKYNFSKFEYFNQFYYEPLFLDDGLVIFDKKGNILRYNENKKIIWKKNFYSKTERKLSPVMSFALKDKSLLVTDSISKLFSVDIVTGNLIWSQKSEYPFNSQIKIYKDKFFVVNYKNILKCFFINDGRECWEIETDESFTVSKSKYSIIIKNNLLVFNNSIGDITAVNISTGLIEWQLPTQKSTIIKEAYDFNYSKLVSDGDSIYFSNNKNEFYSVDINSGTINWVHQVSSILTPIVINDFIFTVTNDGHLVTIQKKDGNIIRVKDIFKNYDSKKKKKLKTTGFSIGQKKIYLSSSDGNLLILDLGSGNLSEIKKISRNLISRPYIYNGDLFIVQNGSVIQYD